jgi:hypothetical protein
MAYEQCEYTAMMEKYTQKYRPKSARGRKTEGEYVHREGHGVAQTSSGAAVYSVLGSLASSRASCMMRLTAAVV